MSVTLGQVVLVLLVTAPSQAGSGLPPAVPTSRSPAIGPELTVSLKPDTLTAHVSSSKNGPVIFNGSVRMDHLVPGLSYTISVSASCQWSVIVSPSTFVVKDDAPCGFYATVVVPPATSSEVIGTVIVSATAKAPGLPLYSAQDQATVTVALYYNADLEVPGNRVELHMGSTTHLLCNLTNECNGPMGFQLQLLDPPDGITLGPVRIATLAQDDSIPVDLAFEVTGDAPAGRHVLVIQIQFSGDAPGAPPMTRPMPIDVVASTGRSLTSLVVVAAVVAVIAGVILYMRRSSRRRRAVAIPKE